LNERAVLFCALQQLTVAQNNAINKMVCFINGILSKDCNVLQDTKA